MSKPELTNDTDASLTAKIQELESLLEQQKQGGDSKKDTSGNIPILDELVTEEDYPQPQSIAILDNGPAQTDITELAEKLEQKFSAELEQVMHSLKDSLKNSIMQELQTELETKKAKHAAANEQPDDNELHNR